MINCVAHRKFPEEIRRKMKILKSRILRYQIRSNTIKIRERESIEKYTDTLNLY